MPPRRRRQGGTVVPVVIVSFSNDALPVALFRYTLDHTGPQIAALSVILIAISVPIMLLIERGLGLTRAVVH